MASNQFIASLDEVDRDALAGAVSKVDLKTGERLVRAGDQVKHAYFPITAIVSVVTTMRDGRSIESRTIGREGGFGLLHALGSRYAYEDADVQVSGEAWRVATADLEAAATVSVGLRRRIVEYAQVTLAQAAQATACNALHDVRRRLCKWLLLTRDRVGSDILPLTQEHLSIMLGVQRTTVTQVATSLKSERLIKYSRGRICVLDVNGLLHQACECYSSVELSAMSITEPSRGQR